MGSVLCDIDEFEAVPVVYDEKEIRSELLDAVDLEINERGEVE